MIEVKNLRKQYGDKVAVENLSFHVEKGEVLGFLGPNGAGKSTTMNIITGYLSATSGEIKINGIDMTENPEEAKKNIGYLPEIPPLYTDMTVEEYLRFIYRLKKIGKELDREKHIEEVCEKVYLRDVKKRLIRNLSKGYRQRVGIAQAMIGNPPILILDEPTVGLDPKQILEIRSLIQSLKEKHTVILSSHILQEIQAVCTRALIINEGKLVTDHVELNGSGFDRYALLVEGPQDQVSRALKQIPGVLSVKTGKAETAMLFSYEIKVAEGTPVRRAIYDTIACRSGWRLLGLEKKKENLEELFIQVTAKHGEIKEDEA